MLFNRGYEKKQPSEDAEKKFYEELSKKAEKSFDWSKEKNPKKKADLIEGCIADVKKIMERKKLVNTFNKPNPVYIFSAIFFDD